MQNVIECKNLTHYYGDRKIFENFNFSIQKGKIVGLLGKNGVGKSTTINILMGFLKPTMGECLVLGESSYALSAKTKQRIGLLHEGHIQYDFMSIEQLEIFYSKSFPNWKKEFYYELVDKLEVPYSQKISKLSCGQRSQVVLGLIFAQDPDVMILDDYSLGLDVGYRRLFLDYLNAYVKNKDKTVLMTTHIVQDLENIIDDIIILDRHQPILQTNVNEFLKQFNCYKLSNVKGEIPKNELIINMEKILDEITIYSFAQKEKIEEYISSCGVKYDSIQKVPMGFEDAFIGYTGKY